MTLPRPIRRGCSVVECCIRHCGVVKRGVHISIQVCFLGQLRGSQSVRLSVVVVDGVVPIPLLPLANPASLVVLAIALVVVAASVIRLRPPSHPNPRRAVQQVTASEQDPRRGRGADVRRETRGRVVLGGGWGAGATLGEGERRHGACGGVDRCRGGGGCEKGDGVWAG